MRNFAPRPALPRKTQTKLQQKTKRILQEVDDARRKEARRIYEQSRQTVWFQPVIAALRSLCGQGELCMYCSSNEPSQVEHFRPISFFPELAFEYENYLWSCDICNRSYKGERFPPKTEPGAPILNPLDDNVWEYFFIEETFGRLLPRFDLATNQYLPRAVSTCEVVGIDRETVQIKRSRRYRNLRREATRALEDFQSGRLIASDLREEVDGWRSEPFQADVADYFLNGPGRAKEPFRSVLAAIGEDVL